jgi:type IV pilus assembly protein PilM
LRFTKPKHVVGLDIGSHSVKAVKVSRNGRGLIVDEVGYGRIDRNQANTDPVAAQADAVMEALRAIQVHNSMVVGALPGQTVVIRYPRLRDVPPERLAQVVEREASQNIPYDLSEVLLDWTVLEENAEDHQTKVLLVAAKHEVIEGRVQIAREADVEYSALSVDSLALADAATGCDYLRTGETTALINIGAQSVSIHFTKDGISNFIRDISWGAKEMIQAISKARRCDYEQAENLLCSANQDAESHEAPAAPVAAATPPPLAGGNPLDPLDDELGLAGNDLGGLDESPTALQHETPLSEILQAPIGRLVSEIRRSFDYYEHQLYERPVDRVILSGGVAHMKAIHSALHDDLGIEDITVAGFDTGPIRVSKSCDNPEFHAHPAQFLVAVGLAARGAADL